MEEKHRWMRTRQWARSTAAVAVLSLTALGVTACGTSGDQSGDDVGEAQQEQAGEDPRAYSGPYDEAFVEDAATLVDADVTLTAQVKEVVSPVAFTITGTEESDAEPLLVVNFDEDTSGLDTGDLVEVTGTYREAYNAPAAEEDLRATPGVEEIAHYDGEPYVEATGVEATDAAGTGPTEGDAAG
ncbi:hypothetical protein ACT4S2_10545 [Kocuria turfanensis]|uniref:hypothetical protein n=1 Tax=Kocuria turfanensis TaxID=388357 RepID=UPI004035053A